MDTAMSAEGGFFATHDISSPEQQKLPSVTKYLNCEFGSIIAWIERWDPNQHSCAIRISKINKASYTQRVKV